MTSILESSNNILAEHLLKQSEQDASVTPMDAVLDAARAGQFTADHCFRLLARLWTLKRTMYYVYGGWAQGINLNEYPPSVAYLFGKQTYDESTHEMQFCDEILRRRWARTQKQLFAHPYAQFGTATRTGSYIFCDDLVRHQLHSQSAEEMMHFMEGKYQIDAYALTPADQKPIEDVFDFFLRPWAPEPSRALGGSK